MLCFGGKSCDLPVMLSGCLRHQYGASIDHACISDTKRVFILNINSFFSRYFAPLSILVLTAAVFLLHGDTLSGWWRWDDPYHVSFAHLTAPQDYFFNPREWQRFSPVNFTPALPFSFDADLWLFGLEPSGFYWHHLLALACAAAASCLLLVRFASPYWALFSTALFVAGAPAVIVARQLMDRHYIEGLALACIALLLFISAQKNRRAIDAWLGAFVYLLAMLGKEIYAPLLMLLPFIRFIDGRNWLKLASPYVLAAAVYVVWRLYMVHSPLSGYSAWEMFSFHASLIQLLHIPVLIFGDNLWGFTGLACLGILTMLAVWRSSRRSRKIFLICWCAGLMLIPLLPLTIWPGINEPGRFLFLPWLGICALVAWAGSTLAGFSRKGALLACVLALPPALAAVNEARVTRHVMNEQIAEMEADLKFFRNADEKKILLLSPEFAALYEVIRQVNLLYRQAGQLQNAERVKPHVVVDELQLLPFDLGVYRVLSYSADCRCLKDVTPTVAAQMQQWRASIREVPLEVSANHSGYQYSWNFGPFETGRYSILEESLGKAPLAKQGSLRIMAKLGVMTVRYDSPEGWITYSRPFRIEADGIEWSDGSDPSSLWSDVFSKEDASGQQTLH